MIAGSFSRRSHRLTFYLFRMKKRMMVKFPNCGFDGEHAGSFKTFVFGAAAIGLAAVLAIVYLSDFFGNKGQGQPIYGFFLSTLFFIVIVSIGSALIKKSLVCPKCQFKNIVRTYTE